MGRSAGSQSRALIIVAKAKGWDPTQIYDYNERRYVGRIDHFDIDPGIFGPAFNPAPDPTLPGGDAAPDLGESVTWSSPQPDGNTPRRRGRVEPELTSGGAQSAPHFPSQNDGMTPRRRDGGDPFSGMGGM